MQLFGVFAGPYAVADDGVLAHADQAAGLADTDALGDMLQDSHGLIFRQAAVKQRRALALGKARLARAAVQQSALLPTVMSADGQIPVTAFAVVRTRFVLAAELAKIIHDRPSKVNPGETTEPSAADIVQRHRQTFNGRRTRPDFVGPKKKSVPARSSLHGRASF